MMRSISVLALACGAGAFAPSTLSRPKTALAVHRPRVAVPDTNFKHQLRLDARPHGWRYGRRTAPKYAACITAVNAASIDA